MVPKPEQSFRPLADWFFISGLDSDELDFDTFDEDDVSRTQAEPTIVEASNEGSDTETPNLPPSSPRVSYKRYSNLSEKRTSVLSYRTSDNRGTASNRSSATIRPHHINGNMAADEVDFEKALRNFAVDRENFLQDLHVSAGVVQKQARPRPRTQRITSDDGQQLKSGLGSVRRRISFREMTSIRRQSSVARQVSARSSRRISNYNAVMPNPQPLNSEANMYPLKRKFEPVLLDRYPPRHATDEFANRGSFPDYVPMFAFPNDIHIVSSDERPRSTWHGFAMTSGDNSKLYGICITIWIPLNPQAAAALEKQCEQWRRRNMSDEERELAASLGERLANERAKLSRLLSKLPSMQSGSETREALEDEISAVEERIGLMAELLRPVRHGAATKIDGLTDGESGFWIPRVYGVLGRDANLTSFYKEWLRAIVVPMTSGAVLRVPPTSPKVGIWQPLEKYVVNLCAEALTPLSSKTQVEMAIRELKLFARKEAINELPGSRNTDLYALFKALSIPQIIILFEASLLQEYVGTANQTQFVLSESRIVLISSHTSMLHLVSRAIVELLYPFEWAGVFIPVLPARLIQALEAPCPYIVGIERRYDNIELPSDDFVLVDLDADEIEATTAPSYMPKQQRRKLQALLQVAAPHHNRFGVKTGPPAYAVESYPWDSFASENGQIFTSRAPPNTLAKLAGLNSTTFGDVQSSLNKQPPLFNAFLSVRNSRGNDRPGTSSTGDSPPSSLSPTQNNSPRTPTSYKDSGTNLQTALREKRSGHFESLSRRSSSFNIESRPTIRRPDMPLGFGHGTSPSVSTISTGYERSPSIYSPSIMAPSTYAQSTLAASTILPQALYQPVKNTTGVCWAEGHHLIWKKGSDQSVCSICDEKMDDGCYRCRGCQMVCHSRCADEIAVVCPAAFFPDQIRAAFVRFFASLLYTYRKFMQPVAANSKQSKMLFQFNKEGFRRSLPQDQAEYISLLEQTQGYNEFIHERESTPATDPKIALFDQIILAKRNRGKQSFFGRSKVDFLSSTADHLWVSAATNPPQGRFQGDYLTVVSRTPAKLDPIYLKEPRVLQGVPRINMTKAKRKPIPSMLGTATLLSGNTSADEETSRSVPQTA